MIAKVRWPLVEAAAGYGGRWLRLLTHVRHCAGTAAVSLVDRLYYGPFDRTEAVNDNGATT